MSWADQGRRCLDCQAVTYRPPASGLPCSWCGGELRDETPAEATARRQHYADEARAAGREA